MLNKIFKRKNFENIKSNINIGELLEEFNNNRHLLNTKRATMAPVHRETQSISLIVNKAPKGKEGNLSHGQDLFIKKEALLFPKTIEYLANFAKEKNSTIARITIVSLQGKGKVYRHYDFGGYYILRNRFHIVLKSEGTLMETGGETLHVKNGDLFYLNNREFHSVINTGEEERIHIIFDLLSNSTAQRLMMLIRWFINERKIQSEKVNKHGYLWTSSFWRTLFRGQKITYILNQK